jgi:hypothetical protein
MSNRQAAKLLGLTPSTIGEAIAAGRLTPPPWTVEQLEQYRHRTAAQPRLRSTRAEHGTVARWAAGCGCAACATAKRQSVSATKHADSERRFSAAQRLEMLEHIRAGKLFPVVVRSMKVSPGVVWGRTRWDAVWATELTDALDRHRPAELPHGKQRGYVSGCRCSECRAALR